MDSLRAFKRPHDKVAMDDIGLPEHCDRKFLRKSTDFLRTDHRTNRRNGRSHPVVHLSHIAAASLSMTTYDRNRRHTQTTTISLRNIAAGGVEHADVTTNAELPQGF